MTREKLEDKINQITRLAVNRELKSAFSQLEMIFEYGYNFSFLTQKEELYETYNKLVSYTIKGIEDPDREKVFHKLQLDIIHLADDLKMNVLINSTEIPNFQMRQIREQMMRFTPALIENAIGQLQTYQDGIQDDGGNKNEALHNLFNYFWITDRYNDTQNELFLKIIDNNNIKWSFKCLMVSALTLSSIRIFDLNKIELLHKTVERYQNQVWHRALVGLVVTIYKYNNRLSLFPEVIKNLQRLQSNRMNGFIEQITIQFIKSKETEKMVKRIHDEIISEVSKMSSKLVDKLDLDNIVSKDSSDDQNPEWMKFIEDSPGLAEKMGKLSMMQMEGSDIFMGTFANLKNFSFFNQMPNWFLPFEQNNKHLQELADRLELKENADNMLFSLEKVPFICNSDKYSFCFNLESLPRNHRNTILSLFRSEIDEMNQLASDDQMSNPTITDRYIFTQYIQDLYRFYKIYPGRKIFIDIFDLPLDIFNTPVFDAMIIGKEPLRKVAEFYIEQKNFERVAEVLEILIQFESTDFELYQKLGYAYQKLKNYNKALDYYLKADLFGQNKMWNYKKIGYCYQKLREPEKALTYFNQVIKNEPDNLALQANMARCMLDLKQYDEALQAYSKVAYLDPQNNKVWRPIAWCYLVKGKFDAAHKYLERLTTTEQFYHDFLNRGHVYFCEKKLEKAAEFYIKSIELNHGDFETFLEEFQNDAELLLQHGINPNDLPLMLDYIRTKLDETNY